MQIGSNRVHKVIIEVRCVAWHAVTDRPQTQRGKGGRDASKRETERERERGQRLRTIATHTHTHSLTLSLSNSRATTLLRMSGIGEQSEQVKD